MIVHEPLVVPLGPIALSGYGIALAAAAVLGYRVVAREYARAGIPLAALEDVIVLLVAGVVGAKLYDVVTADASLFGRGGFSVVGGALVVVPLTWWLARRRGVSLAHMADAVSLGAAAAIPVARTGCWAVGDDYGMPFDGPWAVAFPHGAPPSTAGVFREQFNLALTGIPTDTVLRVHPTQWYDIAAGFLIFVWLWRRRTHVPTLHTTCAFVFASALVRLLMEGVRAKADRVLPFGVTVTQVVMLSLMLMVIVLWRRVRPARALT